jgi:hypothetical protein
MALIYTEVSSISTRNSKETRIPGPEARYPAAFFDGAGIIGMGA